MANYRVSKLNKIDDEPSDAIEHTLFDTESLADTYAKSQWQNLMRSATGCK